MKGLLLALTILVLGCVVSFAGEPSDKSGSEDTAPADELGEDGQGRGNAYRRARCKRRERYEEG